MATFDVFLVVLRDNALRDLPSFPTRRSSDLAILGSVPRSVRSRYHGRVMYMAQLPFTEEWRRQVNPEDLPTRSGEHTCELELRVAVVFVIQFVAAGMYLNEVVQVHCCLIADL